MVETTRVRNNLILWDRSSPGHELAIRKSDGLTVRDITTSTVLVGSQKTTSEGHPWPQERYKGGDVGGEFFTKKAYAHHPSWAPGVQTYGDDGTTRYYYSGPVFACYPHYPDFGLSNGMDRDQLLSYGTTAIARTIPTNPSADTSVFIGELLREGLPSLVGAAAAKHGIGGSSIGGEYLNFVFGWKPLLADIKSMCLAVKNSTRILQQLARDSGKNVRRQYYFPIEMSEEPLNITVTPWPGGYASYSGYTTTKKVTIRKELWFSGCYTYHFEVGSRTQSRLEEFAQKAEHLLGLELTPEVLWNLAPWSWLVDWVSNIGDVFHNVSAFADDGLVLRHGYIMCRTNRVHDMTTTNLKLDRGPGKPKEPLGVVLHSQYGVETKQRLKATPYGFGLDLSGFDLRQWAILGALGMTRAPQVLR